MLSQPRALVLPVAAFAFVLFALWSRYMRSSVMDNLVRTHRPHGPTKGAGERRFCGGTSSAIR